MHTGDAGSDLNSCALLPGMRQSNRASLWLALTMDGVPLIDRVNAVQLPFLSPRNSKIAVGLKPIYIRGIGLIVLTDHQLCVCLPLDG